MHIKRGDQSYAPGDEIELDEEEAKGLVSVVSPVETRAPRGPQPAAGQPADDELDPADFTPAALARAQELKHTRATYKGRRNRSAAGGAKWGVEDVERIHAATDDGDEE